MYTHVKRAGVAGEFSIEEMLRITQERLDEGYTALKYSIIPPIKAIENPQNVRKHVERILPCDDHSRARMFRWK